LYLEFELQFRSSYADAVCMILSFKSFFHEVVIAGTLEQRAIDFDYSSFCSFFWRKCCTPPFDFYCKGSCIAQRCRFLLAIVNLFMPCYLQWISINYPLSAIIGNQVNLNKEGRHGNQLVIYSDCMISL